MIAAAVDGWARQFTLAPPELATYPTPPAWGVAVGVDVEVGEGRGVAEGIGVGVDELGRATMYCPKT